MVARWLFLRLLLMMTMMAVVGCYTETRVVRDGWQGLHRIADRNKSSDRSTDKDQGDANKNPAQGYAILMQTFRGSDRLSQANLQATRLMQERSVRDVWIRRTQSNVHLLRGHYPMPDVDRARQDLIDSRQLALDGGLPFRQARLISLAMLTDQPESSAWDLKQFPGMYSLQIGFYDEQYGQDFRPAAEKAVATLREDGEEAYVYHGTVCSLVCVGLFQESDLPSNAQGMQVYGAKILEVQKRYPYNLRNGLTIVKKVKGQTITQPSFVVKSQ